MRVWVVIGTDGTDEDFDVLGVFSSMEKAEAFRSKHNSPARNFDYSDIESYEIDKE